MVAQVMAEGLDRFIVLAQIFIVLPNQLAPLEEQTRLGAALGLALE